VSRRAQSRARVLPRRRHDDAVQRDHGRAALDLVRAGYAVLPLAAGEKRPLGAIAQHGYRSATRDAAVVARWWRDHASANVGIRTGNAHVVVDVDRRHGGHETLAALEAAHGALPADAAVDTPGGWHLYLASSLAARTHELGPGVELLATAKYAVAPPSITYGVYRWRGGTVVPVADLPAAPAWLLALRPERPRPRDDTPSVRLPRWLPDRVARGARHTMLTRLAGWLRGAGYTEDEIVATLSVVRDTRCEQSTAVTDRYIARLARYIADRPAGRHASDLREALTRVASAWTDRTAARDRRVLLDAVVPIVRQHGTTERIPISIRTVVVMGRVARLTASRALRSLAARGVLVPVRGARHGDDHAAEWGVSSVYTSPVGGGRE
jgi:hypothetical protein